MASEGAELDLYADDIGDEFSQENEYNDSDLYDDVITSNSKSRAGGGGGNASNNVADEPAPYNGSSNQSQNSNHSNHSNMLTTHHNSSSNNDGGMRGDNKGKPCIYVGNLTWWTTDEDVTRSLNSIGINDIIEIKFFENRANGQSKGFCVVTLQLESSVRAALEKLPKMELYGQTIAVTMCNRQNLNNFEMKSRKPGQNGQSNNGNGNQGNNNGGNQNYNNQNNQNRGGGGGNMNFGPNPNMSGGSGRPPLLPGRPNVGGLGRPNPGPLLNNQPRMPQLPHQALPFGTNPQWSQLMQNGPPRNAGMHSSGGPGLNPMLRMPQGNRALGNQPLLSAPTNQGDLRTTLSSVGLAVGQHGLNPTHVNALFGSQQNLVPPNASGDHQFGNRFGGMNPFGAGHPNNDGFARPGMDMGMQMGDAEFEELIMKNKNLANNALARAVTDASSGDYSTAIDTLATAISLISQSRVSHDDRCKIVISSLKDTLQSIETKSYASGGDRTRKDRPRSRERSRDRGSRREKSRRERSRSRERESGYRERSRDRHYEERPYDDRYRKEEGHRERESGRHQHRDSRDHRSRH